MLDFRDRDFQTYIKQWELLLQGGGKQGKKKNSLVIFLLHDKERRNFKVVTFDPVYARVHLEIFSSPQEALDRFNEFVEIENL